MARWTTAFPSYSTLYSFVEVTDWAIKSDRVTFNLSGGITSSYYWSVGGIGCTLGWWESGTYHTIDTDTVSYSRNGGDLTVFSREDYFARQDDDRTVYLYHEGSASGTAYAESSAYTVPHKAPVPSGLTATRVSDTQVNLSWTNPSKSYEAMCIEVSTDGGSWSEVVALFNTSSSLTWNGAAPDHSYRFRIRTYYKANYSAYHTLSGTITMAPASPSSMSTAAAGGTSVTVTLANSSPVATGIEWQTTTGDPSDESAWSASTSVSGSPVTQFTASLGGVGYIRVRNVNSVGASAWLVSEQVVTITPPNPPTLRSPASGAYDSSQGDIVFSWLHNPLDGSAQTAYQLRYAKNGGSWTTLSGTTASSRTVALSGFSVGDSVTWQVRTKGADASYSGWSASQTFTVYTAPSVSITSPTGTITGMPVTVSSTYSDMAGFSCVSSSLALKRDGRTLYTEDMGGSMSATITQGEFLPENGASYTLEVTVRSSSGLTASSSSTFDVQWTPPVAGELNISNDPETGYVSLIATIPEAGSGEVAAISISVSRVNADGTITTLLTDGEGNTGIVDMYAPLNTDYQYAVTTKASSGAVHTVYVDNRLESLYWFAYWVDPDGVQRTAKAKWNPSNGGIQIARPSKTRVFYAGRRDPVSYDGAAVSLAETPAWMLIGKDETDAFVRLVNDGGRGVYKSCDGWVYHADFDLTLSPSYTAMGYYGGASLNVTRIAGERL
jgi:hypothetical protein